MDDRNAQVGWTEAQWNRVREEVLRAWQSVRVAGSFLPVYGGLPRSTQVVPSEMLNPNGTVDERSTAPLLEIALPVILTRQQVLEEDLSSALLQFRRRASQVGQLEDWYIFNGTYFHEGFASRDLSPQPAGLLILPSWQYRPSYPFLISPDLSDSGLIGGVQDAIADAKTQILGLLLRNPGALGLIGGARRRTDPPDVNSVFQFNAPTSPANGGLVTGIVNAMSTLEEHGYVAPYACVFARQPFAQAHHQVAGSTAFWRDRIEPLIGRELLHASALDVAPRGFEGVGSAIAAEWEKRVASSWRKRGVLISVAGDAIDLVVASEATPEFRQIDARGRYVFSVFERFALRIKDRNAIVPLTFD